MKSKNLGRERIKELGKKKKKLGTETSSQAWEAGPRPAPANGRRPLRNGGRHPPPPHPLTPLCSAPSPPPKAEPRHRSRPADESEIHDADDVESERRFLFVGCRSIFFWLFCCFFFLGGGGGSVLFLTSPRSPVEGVGVGGGADGRRGRGRID